MKAGSETSKIRCGVREWSGESASERAVVMEEAEGHAGTGNRRPMTLRRLWEQSSSA